MYRLAVGKPTHESSACPALTRRDRSQRALLGLFEESSLAPEALVPVVEDRRLVLALDRPQVAHVVDFLAAR